MTIIREFSPSRVRNIFICMDAAFCASSSRTHAFDRVRPAHKSEGRDLDHARLHAAFHEAGVHEIVERVEDRAEVRVDPCRACRRAGSRAARPASTAGPRQDQAFDEALLEQRDRVADGEPCLAGAGRPFGKDQLVLLEGADIGVLRRGARPHGAALARGDLLERRLLGDAVGRSGKQHALQHALADGAVDVAHARWTGRA